MFADPRVLEKRSARIWWSNCATASRDIPKFPSLRVLYGMALCVNLDVQDSHGRTRRSRLARAQ